MPFLITDCIESAFEIIGPQAIAKGLNIYYIIEEGTTQMVVGDPSKLRQILINLVNNSVASTESGEIQIHIRGVGKYTAFSVIDTGTGIDPNDLEQLFHPFRDTGGSTLRGIPGKNEHKTISNSLF